MRKVFGPEIIAERMELVKEGNIWQFVKKINKQLAENNIREDGSIDVIANFIMPENLLTKLEELYREAGWKGFDVRFTDPVDGYSGKTIVTLTPIKRNK